MSDDSTATTTALPAGRYWVGDPCYAFTHPEGDGPDPWSEWLQAAWKDYDGPAGGVPRINDAEVRGYRVVAAGTKHGDGEYPSNAGFTCPVDAGLIGVVPATAFAVLSPGAKLGDVPFGMTLVEFPRPFHIEYMEEGEILIGHLVIETGDEDEEV